MREHMGERGRGAPDTPREARLLGLIVAREDRLALLLGGPARWRRAAGRTFLPLELPGGEMAADEALAAGVARLARSQLGCSVMLRASRYTYGATPAHAVDRLAPVAEEAVPPLLRLERWRPEESVESAPGVPVMRRVVVAGYRAALAGEPMAGAGCAGLLWLPVAALRQVVRGLPLGALLELAEVDAWRAPEVVWPADALVYLPAEYGERFLLRVAAKYGHHALFEGGDEGGEADGTGI